MNNYKVTLRNYRGTTEYKTVKAYTEGEAVSAARRLYDGRVICAELINA